MERRCYIIASLGPGKVPARLGESVPPEWNSLCEASEQPAVMPAALPVHVLCSDPYAWFSPTRQLSDPAAPTMRWVAVRIFLTNYQPGLIN